MLRTARDVTLLSTGRKEWEAISCEPGVCGEVLALDTDAADGTMKLTVRVVDSKPVMVAGTLRHRMRLEPL